jgi:hypothetical protein
MRPALSEGGEEVEAGARTTLSLSECTYRLDRDVYRGINIIPCRHGEIGVWSEGAFYARTRDEDVRAALEAIGGVRARGEVFVLEPDLLDPVAEVMGAERLISEAVARPQP